MFDTLAYYHARKSDPDFIARKRAYASRYYAKNRDKLLAKQRKYDAERRKIESVKLRRRLRYRKTQMKTRPRK